VPTKGATIIKNIESNIWKRLKNIKLNTEMNKDATRAYQDYYRAKHREKHIQDL
jgi:hypothetical protein